MNKKINAFRALYVVIVFAATHNIAEGRQEYHKNLTCYMCHTLTHGEFCQNFMAFQNTQVLPAHQCPEKELFCMILVYRSEDQDGDTRNVCRPPCIPGLMVRRYSFSANGTDFKVWMMERNCTKSCQNECVITGDRSKLHLCTSCCEQNFCNIGNQGTATASVDGHGAAVIVMLLYLALIFAEI